MRIIIVTVSLLFFAFACESDLSHLYVNIEKGETFLDDYWVSAIAFSPDGTAWIGTVEQGLIKLKDGKAQIFDASNSAFPDSAWVQDIEIDSRGNVWIAHQGLIKYDGTSFTSYYVENSELPENIVWDIEIDQNNIVWMASSRHREGGVASLDNQTWQIFTPENSSLPVNSCHSIAIDNDNNVWMALTEYVGDAFLARYSDGNLETFGEEELGYSPYWIRNIDVDSRGNVWGVIDYSLSSTFFESKPIAFKFNGQKTTTYTLSQEDQNRYNHNNICVDDYDNIWISSFREVHVLSNENWIKKYASPDEVSIFALEHFSEDKVWIGTNKGIIVLNLE